MLIGVLLRDKCFVMLEKIFCVKKYLLRVVVVLIHYS